MYKFHDAIAEAYQQVHDWLLTTTPAYRRDSGNVNTKQSNVNTAAQFDKFLHTHAFKVQYVLEREVISDDFDSLFASESPIIYIDIACGSGTSSIAFLNTLLQSDLQSIKSPRQILFIGLDIDPFALEIYTKFMNLIGEKIDKSFLQIDFRCVHLGVPDGITEVIHHINNNWNKSTPIPHAILTQVNAVRPFTDNDDTEQKLRKSLLQKQVPIGDLTEDQFSRRVVNSYKRLQIEANIDFLTMIFIGTEDKYDKTKWAYAINNLAEIARQLFNESSMRIVDKHLTAPNNPIEISYENPIGSRWREQFQNYSTKFYSYVGFCTNETLVRDSGWEALVSIENLRLAWVRSRHYMLRESLVDEFEIRLFEADEANNLDQLRLKLINYLQDLAKTSSRLAYNFPKKWDTDQNDVIPRPRVLTRFEEDILAVAIVQVLGINAPEMEGSYEYRLQISDNKNQSEYLYQYYLNGYRDFIETARHEAERLSKRRNADRAMIIQTDIESFYTNINQARLIGEMPAESNRLTWLLSELLHKPIPETDQTPEENRHAPGFGLVQGGTASGFFAKLFLQSIHKPIMDGRVKLFRYADDIIMTVPPNADAKEALTILGDRLEMLGLPLSSEKTQKYEPQEFLDELASQDDLDDWDSRLKDEILRPLYAMNLEYRKFFDKHNDDDTWYSAIRWYQDRLNKLGIHLSEPYLSRKIQENLNLRNVAGRKFPDLDFFSDRTIEDWVAEFHELNQTWAESTLANIRYEMEEQLILAWQRYHKNRGKNKVMERLYLTRIRFFTGRLVYIGFGRCTKIVFDALREPGILRNPRWIIEAIVRQGIILEFLDLLNELRHRNYTADDYMRAVCARALRFLSNDFHDNYDGFLSEFLSDIIHSGSNIEKLMATETLVFLDRRYENLDYCDLLSLLQDENVLMYPQLIRNISMVIILYCDKYTHILKDIAHPIIEDIL